MKYKVLSTNGYNIDDKSNDLIDQGWLPLGGIALTTSNGGNITYAQTFLLIEDSLDRKKLKDIRSLVIA